MFTLGSLSHVRKAVPLIPLLVALSAWWLPATASAADNLYWANETTPGPIRFGAATGGAPSTLATAPSEGGPCGVAVDATAEKIYWATFNGGTIRVANLDGTGSAANLFSGEGSPCGRAVDPPSNKIYWTNCNGHEVRVANLDGTGTAATLVTEPVGSCPSGVAIDTANNKIYWTNQSNDKVRVAQLSDGSGA